MFKTLKGRIRQVLWDTPATRRGRLGQIGVRLGRIIYGVARKFADGELNLRAMSLVYTTLLSLVPLLAVSFSVLKAFGARDRLEPLLLDFLEPLGDKAPEINASIQGFVGNLDVGVLGAVGVAMLFYTTSTLIYKIELALNAVWHVADARSLVRRFSDYFSAVLLGPVLLLALLALLGQLMDSAPLRWLGGHPLWAALLLRLESLGPYLLICGVFTCLYGFLPNTHVKLSAALVGGVFAGVLWYTLGRLFALFVVTSSSYSAMYSGFAGAVLFMLWLYVGWLIVLVGGQVAAFWQHPQLLDFRSEGEPLDPRRREALALDLMTLIGRAHDEQQPPWTLTAFEQRHHELTSTQIQELLGALSAHGLIVATAAEPPGYLPARSIDTLRLSAIYAAVRGDKTLTTALPTVTTLIDEVETALAAVLEARTLRDLVVQTRAIK